LGRLKPPAPNRLYVVFLAPGVSLVNDGQRGDGRTYGPGGFTGFHQSVGSGGVNLPYALITTSGTTQFDLDNATALASHEIAEAATDPIGGGWYDTATGDEIGDFTDGRLGRPRLTARLNGVKIQLLVDQNEVPILPPGAIPDAQFTGDARRRALGAGFTAGRAVQRR
jgi:hypothetical protein